MNELIGCTVLAMLEGNGRRELTEYWIGKVVKIDNQMIKLTELVSVNAGEGFVLGARDQQVMKATNNKLRMCGEMWISITNDLIRIYPLGPAV